MKQNKYIGMRLGEALEKMKKRDVISVGSGSAYIAICTVGEFIKNMEEISDKLLETKKRLAEKPTTKRGRAKQQTEGALVEFKPLRERRIIDIYDRILTQNGTSVIIEGDEIGRVWDIGDVKKN